MNNEIKQELCEIKLNKMFNLFKTRNKTLFKLFLKI